MALILKGDSSYPLPIWSMLAAGIRNLEPSKFSVTEILNPIQYTMRHRQTDYFVHPDDLLFATMGTAWHAMAEKEKDQFPDRFNYEEENHFSVNLQTPYGNVEFHGTPDLYDLQENILWDYKTAFYEWQLHYLLEKGWDGQTHWHEQVNLYRYWKYPQSQGMKIFVFIKDWKRRLYLKYGISKKMVLDVPYIQNDKVLDFTMSRLTELMGIQEGKIPMPECPEKELWIHPADNRRGRCEDYCYMKDICPQYQEYKEERVNNGQTESL